MHWLRSKTLLLAATVVAALSVAATARAAVIHVPADFPTIQQAIVAASSGDTILVAPGTYGAINLLSKKLVIEGTGGAAVTILDAGGVGSVVTAAFGEPAGTTLRGLTLTGGAGQPVDGFASGGGGVYAANGAHLDLADCVISGNTLNPASISTRGGGVLVSSGSGAMLRDCTLSGNTAYRGAALSNGGSGSTLALHGCTVTGNTNLQNADNGGVIDVVSGNLTLSDTLVADNIGSGVWHTFYGISLEGCVFRGNTGWGYGSYAPVGTGVFGCQFLGNGLGGAHLEQGLVGGSDNVAIDCVFAEGDTLQSSAGGVTLLERCTFDGAQVQSNHDVVAHHVIFRNVAAPVTGSGGFSATYSNIQGGAPGAGNIDADPLWVNAALHDYHLTALSPCIDAGDPGAPADPDLSLPDMGAFRYAQWDSLGGGVGFSFFTSGPLLVGQGLLEGGETVGLQLTNVDPLTRTILILGGGELGVPYKGGILWPTLDVVVTDLLADGNGQVSLAATWPAGLPSGLSLWAQFWFKSAGGPVGFEASNATNATAP